MKSSVRRLASGVTGVLATIVISSTCASADQATLELGKKVFLELAKPSCSICHTFADAGAKGEIGPNLDILAPDEERVEAAVTNGIGVMPAYEGLTKEQIAAVAQYVSGARPR